MQVVIFKLKDEQFAVDTSRVQNIGDIMTITDVPKAPPFIKGLINLRGNIISLLDINLLLGIENSNEPANTIILKLDDEEVGITVDEVKEVFDIDEDKIDKNVNNANSDHIRGVIKFENRIVTLIDIEKLL